MSYERFMASFEKLDRDMTECEKLAKLIGGKMEPTKPVQKCKSDATRKTSTSRPQPLHTRSTSSTRKLAPEKTGIVKKPTETSVKVKPVETGARKRTTSVVRGPAESCKCAPTLRSQPSQSAVRSTHSSKESVPLPPPHFRDQKHRSKSPIKHKHLSWGEILCQNHGPKDTSSRNYEDKGARSKSASTLRNNIPFSTKHPHDCADSVPHRHHSSETHDSHSYNAPPRVPPPSLSSEESSGFSSNADAPVNVTNKSVQCGSPPLVHKYFTKSHKTSFSTSSGASCRMDDEDDEGRGLLASEAYAMFNPVRTLNFLVRELHGRLVKAPREDQNAHRIVAEMQKLLHRLPEEGALDTLTAPSQGSKPSNLTGSSQSLDSAQGRSRRPLGINEAEKDIVRQTLASCPSLAKKIEENTKSLSKKIAQVNPQMPMPLVPEIAFSAAENVQFYQKYMEVSCDHLGKVTAAMEKTCDQLAEEKEALECLAHAKEKELVKLKERERDYVTAVNTLRKNLEGLTQREEKLLEENKKLKKKTEEIPALQAAQHQVEVLQAENQKLREENKVLPGLKFIEEKYQAMAAVNSNLIEENKRIQASLEASRRQKALGGESCALCLRRDRDIQTLKLEREKLLLLIKSKDTELEHHRREALNIQRLVEENLVLIKEGGKEARYALSPPPSVDFFSSSSSPSASPSGSGSGSDQEEARGATGKSTPTTRPICSSPNASNFKGLDEVWDNLSTILPEAAHSSPGILVSSPALNITEDIGTFKSLERDCEPWHKDLNDAQGDFSSNDSQRQRLSVQRSEEWLRNQGVVTHSDGVRSDGSGDQNGASTKDLRKTLHQLLKIVQKQQQHIHPKKVHDAAGESSSRVLQVEMPVLPSPPKFLDPPEFSDFSSVTSSHGDHSDFKSLELDKESLDNSRKSEHKKK